ncbi:MAG: M48 family metalloprotease [Snodgrassella sp.]|uniref:M48 family metalloprotease n=1 Tax=Snodgrassella sp. TaxID=2815304 RepID=UPI002590A02E|nr:M48 family metalloprotease [Snodgrassella sp.]MCO6507867.1 M48 family metalloprotease [Snodgrassella sp.]
MPLLSIRLSFHLYPSPQQLESINQEIIQLSLQQQALLQQPETPNNYSQRCEITNKIKQHNFTLTYTKPLAIGGILSGGMCIFTGVIALLLIQRLGRKASKSGKQLHTNFTSASYIMRAILLILPISLFLSFSSSLFILTDGLILTKLAIGLIAVAGLCLSIWEIYNKPDVTEEASVNGVLITSETNPKLYKLIEKIVQKLELNVMPDNIVFCIGHGFKISNQTIYLYPRQTILTGNTLYLDSTYINYLTLAELSSIIAHELSHIASNDPSLPKNFYRQIDRLTETITSFSRSRLFYPAYLLSKQYYCSFNRAIRQWNCSREYRADSNALKIIPKEYLALALSKIHLLQVPINQALDNYYHNAHTTHLPLDYVTHYVAQSEIPSLSKLLKKQPSVYNTHPTLAQRLSAIKYRELNRLCGLLISISPTSLLTELFSHEANSLQANYQKNIQKIAKTNINYLKKHINNHQQTITIKQGGIIRLLLRSLLASLFILITYAFLIADEKHDSEWLITVIILSIISIFCLRRCYKMYQCIGSPLLTITPQGLVLPCFEKAIPWEQIIHYQINEIMYKKLNIYLSPAFNPGKFKTSGAKIKYNRQNNHIQITAYEIKGKINLPDCAPLISDYIITATARVELQLFTQNKE